MSKQGVAVRLRARGDLCADLAGCAGFGLNHDRLLEQRLERCRERPSDYIDRAARREWVDDGDRVRRIGVLREGRSNGKGRGRSGATGDKMASVHVSPPWK